MKKNETSRRRRVSARMILLLSVILIAVAGGGIWSLQKARLRAQEKPETISLSALAEAINAGKVAAIEDTLSGGALNITYRDGQVASVIRDPNDSLFDQLAHLDVPAEQLSKIQVEITSRVEPATNTLGLVIFMGFLFGAVYFVTRSERGGRAGKKSYSAAEVPDLRFSDVAGLDENLQELRDIVMFLNDKEKFTELGARLPRGVLMVGDPGTGKTLIAKAVAGEAGVPFFATSGSEFTEVYVGVGASRMRLLFEKARKKAPCIIFIDEIDAVGRLRHRSESGAEMEQDQTLNQLLVEMDGFDSSQGVIVLAATNRLDVLDPALTRPGRFDRRVHIPRPDVKGRQGILTIHTRGKKLAEDVSLEYLARATPGLVGSDLANIVNEAAINAVRNGRSAIAKADFEEAIEKHLAGGVAQKNRVMSASEKKIVAYHEAGHAVVMHATQSCDPVFKISIIPRGQTGGYTIALPENEALLVSRSRLLARITGLLGGRAAEDLFCQDVTSGASNDLHVATQLAEEMVMRLGMDPHAGLRVMGAPGWAAFLPAQSSQKTAETIDEAVRSILDEGYAQARAILAENQANLERVAARLLEVETLDREEFLTLLEPAETQVPAG